MKKLIGSLLLIFSSTVFADIGSVTELSGLAIIKRGKETITIQKGTVVQMNDKVESKNGKVKITFKDETTVSVTEHSALVIDDFVYDPNSKKGKLGIRATEGTVRYVSGAIAKDPKNVNIKTPTAAIAVRGTDFVMSVNEIGSSMIILMPSCESNPLGGANCVSGKIDVETPSGVVNMDKPYQATFVETASTPPSPPITVNLTGTPIGNNLQITPPRTEGGASIVAAARAAVTATGAGGSSGASRGSTPTRTSSSSNSSSSGNSNSSGSAGASSDSQAASSDSQPAEAKKTEEKVVEQKTEVEAAPPEAPSVVTDLASEVSKSAVAVEQVKETIEEVKVSSSEEKDENPYVKKVWKDKSETKQIGWAYEALGQNNRNYVYVNLPLNTEVQVNVNQNMTISSHNFSIGKAQGSINITQIYK